MLFPSKKRIKISVILPIYNAEEHINKCIDSILKQEIKAIEIIAVNDCSTDNSLEILKRYNKKHPSIKIINHTKNMGAGAARNNALKKSRGKYITFIDSDDWFGDKYLDCLYSEAEKTNADIIFSNMMTVYENVEFKNEEFQNLVNKYHNTNPSLTDLPQDWRSTAPWMKLFRKDFITKNKIKFMEGISLGAEDVPFTWIAYFSAKKISFCEAVYYHYNYVPDSIDRCVKKNLLEIFKALDFTKNECQRFNPSASHHLQLDTLYISHTLYQFRKTTNKSNRENLEIAKLFWKEAHKNLKSIPSNNIINNVYLQEQEKEYYFDIIKHSNFDINMQKKYYSKTSQLTTS